MGMVQKLTTPELSRLAKSRFRLTTLALRS
jgi:hypothetical protein